MLEELAKYLFTIRNEKPKNWEKLKNAKIEELERTQLNIVEEITPETKLNINDWLIVSDKAGTLKNKPFKIEATCNNNGNIEIVIDRKKNRYFNLKMYFNKESWVTKVYKIMAQRFVVNVLECNKPMLDEEGISEEEEQAIMDEYEKILNRLYNVAVKNGGHFNRYNG